MKEFIKNMHKKTLEREVPTTYEYRVSKGIKERPAINPSEAKQVEKQAEDESKGNPNMEIKQNEIKAVGGKD